MLNFTKVLNSINRSIREAVSGVFAPRSDKARVEKLAKRANRRLDLLEKHGLDKSSLAYQYAARKGYDAQPGYTKEGRFRRDVSGMSRKELLAEEKELKKFLSAKTSKVRGYKSSLKKSYESYKQKYDIDLTFDEYKQLFTSKATEVFGYTEVVALHRETGKKISDVIEALNPVIAEQAATNEELGHENILARIQAAEEEKAQKTPMNVFKKLREIFNRRN